MEGKYKAQLDRKARNISREMVEEIIEKDLFPAGFIPRMLEYYYGEYRFSAGRSAKRCVKRGELKLKYVIGLYSKPVGYYYYK